MRAGSSNNRARDGRLSMDWGEAHGSRSLHHGIDRSGNRLAGKVVGPVLTGFSLIDTRTRKGQIQRRRLRIPGEHVQESSVRGNDTGLLGPGPGPGWQADTELPARLGLHLLEGGTGLRELRPEVLVAFPGPRPQFRHSLCNTRGQYSSGRGVPGACLGGARTTEVRIHESMGRRIRAERRDEEHRELLT